MLSLSLMVLSTFVACPKAPEMPQPVAQPAPEPLPKLRFVGLDLSALPADTVLAAELAPESAAWATPQTGWHPLRSIGEQGLGALNHPDGSPYLAERKPFTDFCNEADFNALMQTGETLWMLTHLECSRGGVARTRIEQGPDGLLSAVGESALIDSLEHAGGVYTPCAGQVTHWGSFLSSEEYEPDARYFAPATLEIQGNRYWNGSLPRAFKDHGGTQPYRYGWVPEFTITQDGSTTGVKHYAMGRFSHEIALVVDDDKTVYLSDDNSRGSGFFMFVSDSAQDLSGGALYAARWEQESGTAQGKLSWVNLGRASDAELSPFIESDDPVRFDELFVAADPGQDGLCSEELQLVHSSGRMECLALAEPGERFESVEQLAMVASRLETRRYAALMGATVELEKGEGVAYLAETQELWLALSTSKSSMLAGNPVVPPGYSGTLALDQIDAPLSECGGVFGGRLGKSSDTDGEPIQSQRVLTRLDQKVGGERTVEGRCPQDILANPDNITGLPGQGLVFIGEDSGLHTNNLLWAWLPATGTQVPVLSTPHHAEITGFFWYEIGEFGYLLASVQHPQVDGSSAPAPLGPDTKHMASIVGYLGPFKMPKN